MKKNLIMLMVMIFVWCSTLSVSEVRGEEEEEMGVEEILELLNHPDWKERYVAVSHLEGKVIDDERIKLALIKALEKENLENEEWWGKWWEEYKRTGEEPPAGWYPEGWEIPTEEGGEGEYYLALLKVVIDLKDERAIPVIIGGIACGNEPLNAVVEFGELAVGPLLEYLEKTKDETSRDSAIEALGRILKRFQLPSQTTKLIKETIIKYLNDRDEFVRKAAIEQLGLLEDTSVIPVLKSIAANDPCVWGIVSDDPADWTYPVREEAERVLRLFTPGTPTLQSPYKGATINTTRPTLEWRETKPIEKTRYWVQVADNQSFLSSVVDVSNLVDCNYTIAFELSNNTQYYWRVCASNEAGTSNWSNVWDFTINQVITHLDNIVSHPNPWFPAKDKYVKITFIPQNSQPKVYIYNIAGELVRTLEEGKGIVDTGQGYMEASWDGKNKKGLLVSSGIYLYVVKCNKGTKEGRIGVVR